MAEQRHLIETLQNQVLAPQNMLPQGQMSNNLRYIKKPNDFIYKGNFRNSYARGGGSGTPQHPSVPQRGENGKVVKKDLNVYAANCRSVVNKRKSVEEVYMVRDIDIVITFWLVLTVGNWCPFSSTRQFCLVIVLKIRGCFCKFS